MEAFAGLLEKEEWNAVGRMFGRRILVIRSHGIYRDPKGFSMRSTEKIQEQ